MLYVTEGRAYAQRRARLNPQAISRRLCPFRPFRPFCPFRPFHPFHPFHPLRLRRPSRRYRTRDVELATGGQVQHTDK